MADGKKSQDQLLTEEEGRNAFVMGRKMDQCPYSALGDQGGKRNWWHRGFLAAQSANKFPAICTYEEMVA